MIDCFEEAHFAVMATSHHTAKTFNILYDRKCPRLSAFGGWGGKGVVAVNTEHILYGHCLEFDRSALQDCMELNYVYIFMYFNT